MVLSRGSFGVLYYMVSHFVATYFTCCTRILNHQNVCLTRNYCSSCVTAQFHVVHQDDEITFNNFCATLMTYNECDDESDMLTRKRLKCIPHYSKFSLRFTPQCILYSVYTSPGKKTIASTSMTFLIMYPLTRFAPPYLLSPPPPH